MHFFPLLGRVPSLQEGNLNENVFRFPWLKEGPVVLGMLCKDLVFFVLLILNCDHLVSWFNLIFFLFPFCYVLLLFNFFFHFPYWVAGPRFKDAFQEPNVYLAIEPFFEVGPLGEGLNFGFL